jgi:hypothetical protein
MTMHQDAQAATTLAIFNQLPKEYDCIEALFECASACWISADACLNEFDRSPLKDCILKSLECAEVCAATARQVIQSEEQKSIALFEQLKQCIEVCKECIEECQVHSVRHEHCMICTKCCEHCIRLCEQQMNAWAA